MRKIVFSILLLLALAATSFAQTQPGDVYKTVKPAEVPAALAKCAPTKIRHTNPGDEESSPVFISADLLVLFYVYSNERTGMFDFIVVQSKGSNVAKD